MFKIANNTKPTTNWGDLIASVELFQQVTGSTKIFSQDANLNRQPPNYNKAFSAGVEDEYQQERDPRKCYNCGKPGHFDCDCWSSWNWETGVGDVEGKGGKGGKGGKDGKGNKGEKGGKGNGAPRGGKGGKGYQGNKGWKSNKETSYVIDAGGDDEVHTCFVLNDSNPSSDAPTHVTISNSAMNLLLGKDDDDGEVELKTTQARGDMIAAHGRMGARSPQRRSYSILSSQPTPPPPHPHQFTTQSELWLVKVLRKGGGGNSHSKKRQQGRP